MVPPTDSEAGSMRIAAAQIAPVLLDRAATIARTCDAIADAAAGGAKLVAFGETFIPGYPVWLSRTGGASFDNPDQKQLHARYLAESISIEDGDLDAVCAAARDHGINVVVGVAERPIDRGGHSIFCSCVVIDATGVIRSVHRKLVPTYEERLAWSHGDTHGLVVHEIGGFRVGALNCWENWMPLARAALYAQGVNLIVMIWPGNPVNTSDITRFVARESRSWVLSASAILTEADLPADLLLRNAMASPGEQMHAGGSAIAAPDGTWAVEPVENSSTIVYADIDLNRVRAERQNFDPAGHYARPDLLQLKVDGRRI